MHLWSAADYIIWTGDQLWQGGIQEKNTENCYAYLHPYMHREI